MLYEISLKIRIKDESHEKSYYEVWRMNVKYCETFFSPILDDVRKRPEPSIKMPEKSDIYQVLVDAGSRNDVKDKKAAFTKGRKLIRDYLEGSLLNKGSLVIKD